MKMVKAVVLIAVLGLGLTAGWRVGASEWENIEFQQDLHDLSTQVGIRIGHYTPMSDDQFRDAVIKKAQDEGIQLQPEQVTVERSSSGSSMFLAAHYDETINLPGYSFVMHFAPSSTKSTF